MPSAALHWVGLFCSKYATCTDNILDRGSSNNVQLSGNYASHNSVNRRIRSTLVALRRSTFVARVTIYICFPTIDTVVNINKKM